MRQAKAMINNVQQRDDYIEANDDVKIPNIVLSFTVH